jgi:hypothetical protein
MWYAALVPLVGAVVATMAGYRWLGRMTIEGVAQRASGGR